jgi:CTP:molybdopterin cytidylyltransferase MocA
VTGPAAPRVRALLLAAGAGSRFGGAKLAALLDGKPILQHVLDSLAGAGFDDPVVVLAPNANLPGIDWRRAERIINPDPGRGLASSLQVGWESATSGEGAPDAVLIALADQPLVRADVLRQVAAMPVDGARPIVAARYTGTGAPNPVRVEASGAAVVAGAAGDRGLGPVLERHRDRVRWVDVEGDNPDVDTAADLAHVAERLRGRQA